MTTKTKIFDAVIESRKWKVRVAEETANMSPAEISEYFSPERTRQKIREALKRDRQQDASANPH